MADIVVSKHSAQLAELEKKLKKHLALELPMTQAAYHRFNGHKQVLEDLTNNYYGMWDAKEERAIAYYTAEVGSRLRRLNEHLREKGHW